MEPKDIYLFPKYVFERNFSSRWILSLFLSLATAAAYRTNNIVLDLSMLLVYYVFYYCLLFIASYVSQYVKTDYARWKKTELSKVRIQ